MPPIKVDNPYLESAREPRPTTAEEAEKRKDQQKKGQEWKTRAYNISYKRGATNHDASDWWQGTEDGGAYSNVRNRVTVTDEEGTTAVLTFTLGETVYSQGVELDGKPVLSIGSPPKRARLGDSRGIYIGDDLVMNLGLPGLSWEDQKDAIDELLTTAEEALGMEPYQAEEPVET